MAPVAPTVAPRKKLKYIYDDVEFYQHQIEGVRKLVKLTSFLLADEMGLGKTLTSIALFAIDVEQGLSDTLLVVCPATLKGNWAEECEKFTRFKWMVLDGPPKKRSKQLDEFRQSWVGRERGSDGPPEDDPYRVLIVNYEQIKPHLDEINELGFDVVIADEAHMLKSPTSARTKAFHGIVAARYFMLTGSPMLNHVHELWSLLHRINPDAYPNYYRFLHRYAVFGGYEGKQIVGTKNEKELVERLRSVMLRRRKEDVINLPEKLVVKIPTDMHSEQRRVYKEIQEQQLLTLPDDPDPMEIENALTSFLRLKQVCGTLACFDGFDDVSGKLDDVIERWVQLYDEGHKVVFFTQFRQVLDAVTDRFVAATGKGTGLRAANPYKMNGDTKKGDRVPMVREWAADPNPNPIGLMFQVGGVGLNMTASRHVFLLDRLYVPTLNDQAIDRLHRIGADVTQPVTIFEPIARNSIESRIETILRTKRSLFGAVVDDKDFKRKLVMAMMEDDVDE